ncbi:MAG: CCA tRNA nucleotidyltransferase [Actinomycetota bacterium]|nr:CCA tRNA nucleotidyltransferase [Actinomycetota bacterium]
MDGIAQSDRDDLVRRVGSLSERFVATGWGFFVVGGVVRDLLLGKRSGDIDITTDAHPEETASILSDWGETVWDQGARFGTIGARRGDVVVEVTTHRSEQYEQTTRKPQVKFSGAIEEDLARRDFTVNSMAIEFPSWRLVDPFNGREHLDQGVLSTPLSPQTAFSEDPLRMLRAARFAAGYGLTPDQELENAIADIAERLTIVSKERINDEMSKFLMVEKPGNGIALLQRTGLIKQIFPKATNLEAIKPDALDLVQPNLVTRWASLLWPVAGGTDLVRSLLKDLRVSKSIMSQVAGAVGASQQLSQAVDTNPASIRRLLHAVRPNTALAIAIVEAHRQAPPAEVLTAIRRLEAEEGTENFEVPLNGFEVAKLIGKEGPDVGATLDRLMEYRLDSGPLSKEEATALVLDWKTDG